MMFVFAFLSAEYVWLCAVATSKTIVLKFSASFFHFLSFEFDDGGQNSVTFLLTYANVCGVFILENSWK